MLGLPVSKSAVIGFQGKCRCFFQSSDNPWTSSCRGLENHQNPRPRLCFKSSRTQAFVLRCTWFALKFLDFECFDGGGAFCAHARGRELQLNLNPVHNNEPESGHRKCLLYNFDDLHLRLQETQRKKLCHTHDCY